MPAAVAKGIIISISIIAALSIAVLENPQVQSWLEEQRRKIAELLRSAGQDLDPESRRRAEAFAFEGRDPIQGQEPLQEASRSPDTAVVATGSSLSNASTIRRIPVKGPADPVEAEERRRKGREYLAKRNQQMIELQERRNLSKSEVLPSPPTPTSFDAMVDSDGNLKDAPLSEKESSAMTQPIPEQIQEEMKEVERHLQKPMLVGQSSVASMSGWQMGSETANPFGDEYALERSITPRPAPPREATTARAASPEPAVPGSFTQPQPEANRGDNVDEELTYEEQLAIAMSLSEQESVANAATLRQDTAKEDADLRRAIRASLKDLDAHQAAHAVAQAETSPRDSQPLVDLTPPTFPPAMPHRSEWESAFHPSYVSAQGITSHFPPRAPPSETTDELYCITPELTHARLASFDAQQNSSASASVVQLRPFNQVHQVSQSSQPVAEGAEASFHSAASVISLSQNSGTLDYENPQLIDFNEDMLPEGAQTPRSRTLSPTGFHSDFRSETIGSTAAPVSPPASQARSETSAAEMVELEDDSDVDMLSEEGDGIATPDSWSEVGSRDAESDAGDHVRPVEAI